MSTETLRIVWIYPDLLSTYGDRGNMLILARRAADRGIPVETYEVRSDQRMPNGADIYLKTMGRVVGIFATEVGTLNQVVHMVAFDDLADRTRRRTALRADPAWEAYARQVRPMIVHQEKRLMVPAPFSPLR